MRFGCPYALSLRGDQAADITQSTPVMHDISAGALLAYKRYDANALPDRFVQRVTSLQ